MRHLATAALAGVTVLATLAAAGCNGAKYTTPARYERGLVICLSGAGGITGECGRIRDGLNAGGVDRAIEIFEWSKGGVLSDQVAVEENRLKAAELAERVEAYLAEHPGRPVHLIGLSAGTGLVVWALEDLSVPVEGAILLASSLDARYDLTPALSKVRDRLYSFNSLADTVLGLGIAVAGTVDREGGVAGGLGGFSPPHGASEADKALYNKKLVQSGWWPGDVILGNLGDHLGTTNPLFVQARLAPLVLGKHPVEAGRGSETVASAGEPKKSEQKSVRSRSSSPSGGAAGHTAADRRKRGFFGWEVGARQRTPVAAGVTPGDAVEESQFFRESERMP
jgi:hypothetical protein